MYSNEERRLTSASLKRDSDGVSVDREAGRNEGDCIDTLLAGHAQDYGVFRLRVQTCDENGAMVVGDPVEGNEYHSSIRADTGTGPPSKRTCKMLAREAEIVKFAKT